MRILILGNNYSAQKFYELFKNNNSNIVFCSMFQIDNSINLNNAQDIVEFCEANEINLILITDKKYNNFSLQECLNKTQTLVFSLNNDTIEICSSKSYAKKFMFKNKIRTPEFQIFDKPLLAIDSIRKMCAPKAIKPDEIDESECAKFIETYTGGQKIINDFFKNGTKKIVIEDYVEGKNITAWALCDGYNIEILWMSAKYQNNISYFEPSFCNEELKERIYNEILIPTMTGISCQNEEYIGILGLDMILTYSNELFLIGYRGFLDDLNTDFLIEGFDLNLAKVFESTIIGDAFLNYRFKNNNRYMLSIRENNEIRFISANTMTNLERFLKELDINTKELEEAKKVWNY